MASVLEIIIQGRDQFSPAARNAQTSATGLGGSMSGLGKTVAGVAGGFIAAQASIAGVQKIFSASIGSAMQFEHQMAQIRGLTGATKQDTDLLEGSIKSMAKSMPKSPAELGAGAYYVISAGITDAAEAADVLEISAKASAAGLGETEVVADAVTSALNAYKMEASEAERMTDILTTTVRLGKTEASALAGSIGRILPVAAAMGVNFEEVGANLAVMTKVGLSADEAATSLRATMTSLLKPSKDAETALAEMGMSSQELRDQIREKGLLATLQTLMDLTGGNEAAIARIIPNVRALTNVLGTVGSQGETYVETLEQMNEAQGATERAFGEVAETAEFKLQLAMNQLNVVLMDLGERALPVMADAAGVASDAITVLSAAVSVLEGDLEELNADTKEAGFNLLELAARTYGLGPAIDTAALGLEGDLGGALEGIANDITFAGRVAGLFGEDLTDVFGPGGVGDKALTEAQQSWGLIDGAIADAMATQLDFETAMTDRVAPGVADALGLIQDKADETRDALTGMFKETTQEEAAAEYALALLKEEAARLEAKTGDLTAKEQTRLDLLNDELIPAQQANVDLLRAQKDTLEKSADAHDASKPSMKEWREEVDKNIERVDYFNIALGKVPSKIDVKIALGLATTAELDVIKQAIGLGVPVVPMQYGGIVTRPTLALLAEHGKPEAVVPLDRGQAVGSADAVGAAVAKALRGVHVEMDGHTVGRLVGDYLGAEASLIGRGG